MMFAFQSMRDSISRSGVAGTHAFPPFLYNVRIGDEEGMATLDYRAMICAHVYMDTHGLTPMQPSHENV